MAESSLLTETPDAPDRDPRESPFFIDNMEAFRAHAPHLHARLVRIGEPPTRLVVDDDGALDISFRGRRFYREDAVLFTQRQLARYLAAPERRFIENIAFTNLAGLEGKFARALTAVLDAESAGLADRRIDPTSHFAVVFGLGLGLHLDPLIAFTQCTELIVVEPSFDNLYHSLFVTDWRALFDRAACDGRAIHFVFDKDQDSIASHLRKLIRLGNPALLDGAYVYQHYGSSVLTAARLAFHRDFALHVFGLGYFEDELLMTANAVANLKHEGARILASPQQPRDEPVFICGSGPSIDGDLDVIAAQRDRALVVSIGSVLRTLLAHGIHPDIHVEAENHPDNAANVQRAAEEFGLAGVTLLAASTVQPAVTRLFDEVIFYFRDSQTPVEVFGNGIDRMGSSGPTVANAALVTLLHLGFRAFYLFGIDMGSRHADRYHSADTYIGRGESAEWAGKSRLPIAANFGGDAVADAILGWSRIAFENVLKLHRDVRCVNCSDGVRIDGTIPMLPQVLDLPDAAIDRAAVWRDMLDKLPVFKVARAERIWREADLATVARAVLGRVDAVLAAAAEHDDPGFAWADELYELLSEAKQLSPAINLFLFGTTVLFLGTFWWFDGRIEDAAVRHRFRRAALRELRLAYRGMERRLAALADDVGDYLAGRRAHVPAEYDG